MLVFLFFDILCYYFIFLGLSAIMCSFMTYHLSQDVVLLEVSYQYLSEHPNCSNFWCIVEFLFSFWLVLLIFIFTNMILASWKLFISVCVILPCFCSSSFMVVVMLEQIQMKSHPHPERPDRIRAIAASLATAGIYVH